jgi:hypothetical protein
MGKLQNANIVEILIFLFMYRLEEKKLFLIFIHFQYVQSSGFHALILYNDNDNDNDVDLRRSMLTHICFQ